MGASNRKMYKNDVLESHSSKTRQYQPEQQSQPEWFSKVEIRCPEKKTGKQTAKTKTKTTKLIIF